ASEVLCVEMNIDSRQSSRFQTFPEMRQQRGRHGNRIPGMGLVPYRGKERSSGQTCSPGGRGPAVQVDSKFQPSQPCTSGQSLYKSADGGIRRPAGRQGVFWCINHDKVVSQSSGTFKSPKNAG